MGSLLKEHSLGTDNDLGSDIPTCISGSGVGSCFWRSAAFCAFRTPFSPPTCIIPLPFSLPHQVPFKHEDLPALLSNLFPIYSQTHSNDEHLVSAPASVLDTLDVSPQFTLSTVSRESYTCYFHFKNKKAED